MRTVRNTTDEPLNVPLLNATIQPGDVAPVPDNLNSVDFSVALFEDSGKSSETEEEPPPVIDVHGYDEGSTEDEEGS